MSLSATTLLCVGSPHQAFTTLNKYSFRMGPHNATQFFLAYSKANQNIYFYFIYYYLSFLFTTAKLKMSTLPGEGSLCGMVH
jgi:hypothetical protein